MWGFWGKWVAGFLGIKKVGFFRFFILYHQISSVRFFKVGKKGLF